ncbi:MAG: rhodanese-like domain-containing protein, partial [Verrucomicrobiota bacterium]
MTRKLPFLLVALGLGISSPAVQGADPLPSRSPESGVAVRASGPRDVGVAEFERLRADSRNVVLDVRTKEEWEAGHLPGATLLDFNGPNFAA